MALSHISKTFAVSDAKISKITADASGGSTTYATSIDVPGIKSVTIGGDINSQDLRGDNTLLDYNAVLTGISLSFEYAKLQLDALGVMLGGSVTDSGTTPNQVATYSQLATQTFNYFKFEARTPTAGVDTITGDAHIVLYKCILTDFPELGFAEEGYKTYSVGAKAMPALGTGTKWMDIVLNETQAVIS